MFVSNRNGIRVDGLKLTLQHTLDTSQPRKTLEQVMNDPKVCENLWKMAEIESQVAYPRI